jgi:hypothetical protein
MVKKDYVKKTEKGDDVTRFWYTLKNLDPMVKCSPCKWVSQICMKYKLWSLDRFLVEHMLQHGRAQVVLALRHCGCSQNLKINLFPIAS